MKSFLSVVIATVLILTMLILPACSGLKVKECHFEKVEDPYTGEKYWMLICTGEMESVSDLDQLVAGIDTSDVVLDLSGSTAQVSSVIGDGWLKKKDSTGDVVASGSFNWVRLGNGIIFSDPENVSLTLNSAPGQAVMWELVFSRIEADSVEGLNTLVGTIFHDGTAYESAMDTWFCLEEEVPGGGLSPIADLNCSQ